MAVDANSNFFIHLLYLYYHAYINAPVEYLLIPRLIVLIQ